MKRYKIFRDLKFGPHAIMPGLSARLDFENGYGVSVVRFQLPDIPGWKPRMKQLRYGSYTSDDTEWELAVFHAGEICYSSPISDDVIGNLKADQVSKLMRRIQQLPPNEGCSHLRLGDLRLVE